MEQKPVAGKHLGGILRIFAKSVRDAAQNKKPTKSKPLESKVSSSDDQNDGTASDTSPRSEARSKTIISGDREHLSQILTIRTRRNSENIVNKQDVNDLQEQKTISSVSKTLSLDNLADHSFEGKENRYPKFQKNKEDSPKKMEDWGSDLLDVDSCRGDNGHDSAVVSSGLCGGSSVIPAVSSGRRKSSSDVCHRTVISHDIHVQLEEQECTSSSVNSTTQKVCKQSKEQESLRVRGEKLKKSEKTDRYHKHHRHGFQKENYSKFHDKPVENTRKDVNKVHKKHNIKDGMPQNMVKDSCQPMTHKFSETKGDRIQGKENDSTDQIDSKLPRNLSHNCIDNGSSNDEDWSSELLVVVSRSSPKLTDTDASILCSTTDIQEDNLVMSPEENSDSVSLDSEQDLRTVKIEVVKGENERFHSSQCSAVFAEEMSDSLDVTLTGVEDEDWSTDLMSVPSSASTSPESGRNLAIAEEYDNTHQNDQPCHGGNEVSDSEGCPLEEASCLSQSNQSDDLEAEGSFKNVLVEGDDYLNEKDMKIRKQVIDPASRQYTGFVDDSSDTASDHECVSDLDSQGSGIGRTESVNDDIDNYNFLSQEGYQDHAPTCTCHIQSENDCSRRKKKEARSVSFGNVNQDLPRNLQHRFHEEQLPKDRTREEMSQDTGYHIQDTPPGNCYPFLCIPLENIKSRASIEKLMEYIANVDLSHQMYPMEARTNHQDQGGSVWFNVTQNPDRQELHVGMNPHHPPNHAGGYPWTWPYGWTPYRDPRYEMCDPNMSPSRLKAYYDSIWHNYQSGYPYSYMHSWEGVDSKMPADDCQSAHPVPHVATRDQKIVDYESSSEDEIMAKLASKHMMGPIYRSTGHQNYVGAEPGRKSYAACVTGNKRSLPENLRVSGKKLHNLGAPKPARAMPGVCVDWNESMLYDKQELEILNKDKVWEKTQRQVIEQCKMSSIDGEQRNVTQGLMNNECRSTDGTNPKLWSQTRRNRFITDNPDLQETYELGTCDRKESISGGMREAMKSAGCYPYDTIKKMTPKYEETENCCKKTHIPQLIPPGQWSSWAIGKSPESLKRETHTSSIPEYGQASRNETESNPILSTPSPPPPVPVCPPYWGDPRMSFPVPAFYPPQWLPSFPNNYSPGFMPYPPPPSTTSPTNISPAMNTGSTTISSPTSTSSRFPYRSQQTTSFRSRTTSEPAPVVDQITERVEEPGVDKSCKSYFLAAKNRRVSDSVLRTDSEEFVPRRSSYASRLQNDARLNANFPQLDWRIRLKSRCKGYGVGFIDTHCHLDFLFNREGFKGTFAKYMLKHEETFPENFEGCVAVFCNPASFLPKSGLWRDVVMESNVWLAMGCHPKNVTSFDTVAVEGLKQCINHPKIIAVGEIGLDYSGTFRQHEVLQKKMFAYQLQLALDVKKPLVIHCRQAEEDCLAIMEEIVPKNYKIHCHCFTGTYEQCKKWLTKFPKLYIGLTNLVSFRSATPTHEVAKYIPLGRLLLETDAPYFVPRQIPKGAFELSHPGMAVLVAEEVARIKEIPVGQVLKACRNNTLAMYGI